MITWFYVPKDGGERVTIGSWIDPPHPAPCVTLTLIETDDCEQAEEWRQALAAGRFPRVSHDQWLAATGQPTAREESGRNARE
jgi:hypothetical protein